MLAVIDPKIHSSNAPQPPLKLRGGEGALFSYFFVTTCRHVIPAEAGIQRKGTGFPLKTCGNDGTIGHYFAGINNSNVKNKMLLEVNEDKMLKRIQHDSL